MRSYDVTHEKIQALMALFEYRRHMGYFFVNLLSEKIFKSSVLVQAAQTHVTREGCNVKHTIGDAPVSRYRRLLKI